jgi:hypothetical protein
MKSMAKYLCAVIMLMGELGYCGGPGPARTAWTKRRLVKKWEVAKGEIGTNKKIAGEGNVITIINRTEQPVFVVLVKTSNFATRGKRYSPYGELYTEKNGNAVVRFNADQNLSIHPLERDDYTAFVNFGSSLKYDRTLWISYDNGALKTALDRGFVDKSGDVAVYNVGGLKPKVSIRRDLSVTPSAALPDKTEARKTVTVELLFPELIK